MSSDEDTPVSFEQDLKSLAIIAKPLASPKLHKKIYKLVRKAAKAKALKRGVKETVKSIRKNIKGVVFLAGDISPIDVLSHLPVLCEEANIPYVYVTSKTELGAAALSRRPTCCLLVTAPKGTDELNKYYEKCVKDMKLPQTQ